MRFARLALPGLGAAYLPLLVIAAAFLAPVGGASAPQSEAGRWTERELRILRSMRLTNDDREDAADPSNAVSDDSRAAVLGKRVFFDPGFSGDGRIACASCHKPGLYYTDGLKRSRGAGTAMRNAPTIVGASHQRWFYWDGRRDSLWSQALIPFEAADEMGGSRVAVTRRIGSNPDYRNAYESVFGPLPDRVLDAGLPEHAGPYGTAAMRDRWRRLPVELQREINAVYANIGKAIAAFESTRQPPVSRFDRYVDAVTAGRPVPRNAALDDAEIAGAKLFMNADRTQCLQCHNGPMLTNGDFHNIGTGNFTGPHLDYGRVFGLRSVLMDEFNCLGPYSDAERTECAALRFLNRDSHVPLEGAFKVPTLRGLKYTAPYFHDGRFASLREVLDYYDSPPQQDQVGPHELRNPDLAPEDLVHLEKFLLTLSAPMGGRPDR